MKSGADLNDFLAGWRDITPKMRQRVRRVLKDWQQHARPFEDTAYWAKRFAPFADIFAHTLPAQPVQLYRSERTDIDNRYTDRYTSWSRNPDAVKRFGWGQRRMVTAVFTPDDILVDFVNLGLDTEGFQEVIVRPGHYNIIPWRIGWDRTGVFNVYEQPERARAAGITLGAPEWDPEYGQIPTYARHFRRERVPVSQIASPFMNPIRQERVDELAELEDEGYELPPVIVDGPSEVEEVDYPEEKYPFLDGHYPEVGEDVWFVHDGHHRVTLAIQRGQRYIDALVMGTETESAAFGATTIACGECFTWAYQNLPDAPNARLVHAIVHDPWSGKAYLHAWIERAGKVYDWQSVVQGLGPGRRGWGKKKFYAAYQPVKRQSFTFDASRAEILRQGHYGPW